MAIEKGMLFSSFEEFHVILKKHEDECGVLYVKDGSKKFRKESPFSERLQYEQIKFVCKQGHRKQQSTSRGIRPNQTTIKTGCPAFIRLVEDRATCKLKVTNCHLVHENHSTGQKKVDELLIQCVQKHSVLYDKLESMYSNVYSNRRDSTQKAWAEIAADLNATVDVVKTRWTYLRHNFLNHHRCLMSLNSEEWSAKKKKWPLYDSLTFLLPCREFGNTTTFSDGVSETHQSLYSSDDVPEESVLITFDNQLEDSVNRQQDMYLCQQPSRKRTMNELDHQYFSAPKEQHHEEDDHEYFLKSLLPMMRTLDSLTAMEFRHEVQGLLIKYIKKAHMQDMPKSSGSPP